MVGAEPGYQPASSDRLPMQLQAVKADLGKDADRVLADAGLGSEGGYEPLKDNPTEPIRARVQFRVLGAEPAAHEKRWPARGQRLALARTISASAPAIQ